MSPDEALRQHTSFINEVGEDTFIRRYSGSPRTPTDYPARARVVGYSPKDIVGNIQQGDRRVIMLVSSLASILPVTTSDKVVVRGKEITIVAVDDNTRRVGGILIALELQVRG